MYKVLTEYAKVFGEDFPISKMSGYSAYEINRKAQDCLATNNKNNEITATSAATASRTNEIVSGR